MREFQGSVSDEVAELREITRRSVVPVLGCFVETIDANRRLNVVARVTFGAKRKVPRCREGVK
jgi:hypothetical protein